MDKALLIWVRGLWLKRPKVVYCCLDSGDAGRLPCVAVLVSVIVNIRQYVAGLTFQYLANFV